MTPSSAAWSSDDAPGEDGHEHAGDQRPSDGPADDPVDLVQPISEDGDPDGYGNSREGEQAADPADVREHA